MEDITDSTPREGSLSIDCVASRSSIIEVMMLEIVWEQAIQ